MPLRSQRSQYGKLHLIGHFDSQHEAPPHTFWHSQCLHTHLAPEVDDPLIPYFLAGIEYMFHFNAPVGPDDGH